MSKITKEEELKIIELYQLGKSSKEVAALVNRGSTSVLRVLKRNNIEVRTVADHTVVNKYNEDKEKEIIRLYIEEGKHTNYIAHLFNTYNTTIRRILIRNNVPLRSASVAKRKVLLSDIKDKEGTRDFDYFIGLLATDGCVTNNKIVFDFSEANKELLDYWNEFLGNKCNINVSIHKVFKVPQYRIAFRNSDVAEYLKLFGIVERKSFNLKLSYINWDVLRGIIDGDGCISSTNHGTTLRVGITSGCKIFLELIQDFLEDYHIKSTIYTSNRNLNPTYDLYVYRTEDIVLMYENLYKNAHFYLKRKKLKFGPLLLKYNSKQIVNSGNELCNSNPEPSHNVEGVETLHDLPKD